MSLTKTQAGSGAAGGSAIVLVWALACWKAHTMLVPTLEQAIGILVMLAPFLHLVARIVMYWTSRLLPKDAEA